MVAAEDTLSTVDATVPETFTVFTPDIADASRFGVPDVATRFTVSMFTVVMAVAPVAVMFSTSLSVVEPSINVSVAAIVAVMPFTVSSAVVNRKVEVKAPVAAIVPEAMSTSGVSEQTRLFKNVSLTSHLATELVESDYYTYV